MCSRKHDEGYVQGYNARGDAERAYQHDQFMRNAPAVKPQCEGACIVIKIVGDKMFYTSGVVGGLFRVDYGNTQADLLTRLTGVIVPVPAKA